MKSQKHQLSSSCGFRKLAYFRIDIAEEHVISIDHFLQLWHFRVNRLLGKVSMFQFQNEMTLLEQVATSNEHQSIL